MKAVPVIRDLMESYLIEGRVDFIAQKYKGFLVRLFDFYKGEIWDGEKGAPWDRVQPYNSDVDPHDNPEAQAEWDKRSLSYDEWAKAFVEWVSATVDPAHGPYTQWIIGQVMTPLEGRRALRTVKRWVDEDAYKTKEALEVFHANKRRIPIEQRDINKHSMGTLVKLVRELERSTDVGSNEAARRAKSGAKKIHDSESVLIVIPTTYESSVYYGRDTQWCTASNKTDTHFKSYTREGPLYIIIDRETDEKYQAHPASGHLMDAEDSPFPKDELPEEAIEALKSYASNTGDFSLAGFFGAGSEELVAMASNTEDLEKKIVEASAHFVEHTPLLIMALKEKSPEKVKEVLDQRNNRVYNVTELKYGTVRNTNGTVFYHPDFVEVAFGELADTAELFLDEDHASRVIKQLENGTLFDGDTHGLWEHFDEYLDQENRDLIATRLHEDAPTARTLASEWDDFGIAVEMAWGDANKALSESEAQKNILRAVGMLLKGTDAWDLHGSPSFKIPYEKFVDICAETNWTATAGSFATSIQRSATSETGTMQLLKLPECSDAWGADIEYFNERLKAELTGLFAE